MARLRDVAESKMGLIRFNERSQLLSECKFAKYLLEDFFYTCMKGDDPLGLLHAKQTQLFEQEAGIDHSPPKEASLSASQIQNPFKSDMRNSDEQESASYSKSPKPTA